MIRSVPTADLAVRMSREFSSAPVDGPLAHLERRGRRRVRAFSERRRGRPCSRRTRAVNEGRISLRGVRSELRGVAQAPGCGRRTSRPVVEQRGERIGAVGDVLGEHGRGAFAGGRWECADVAGIGGTMGPGSRRRPRRALLVRRSRLVPDGRVQQAANCSGRRTTHCASRRSVVRASNTSSGESKSSAARSRASSLAWSSSGSSAQLRTYARPSSVVAKRSTRGVGPEGGRCPCAGSRRRRALPVLGRN